MGPDLTLKNNGSDFYNALKTFFNSNNGILKLELKIDTGISFWKEFMSGIDQDYTYYKILEEPKNTQSNWWMISKGKNSVSKNGTDFANWKIYDTYSRQMYFKFQNILYLEQSANNIKEINSKQDLYNYFNEYMGINENNS